MTNFPQYNTMKSMNLKNRNSFFPVRDFLFVEIYSKLPSATTASLFSTSSEISFLKCFFCPSVICIDSL